MQKVLIITHDKKLGQYLCNRLTDKAFFCLRSDQELDVIEILDKNQPDIVLLDINVKNVSGESICWDIKKEYSDMPIILIIEKVNASRILKLYRAGADDFITKPIDINKLISRMEMRMAKQRVKTENLKVGDLVMDLKNYQVKRKKKYIKLTPREFRLLRYLVQNKNRVLSREMILNRVWSYDNQAQSRAVDVYMGYLRKKIDNNFKKKLIRTVRGFGYMIKE
jgi:DNA-binding response OmpR family regulator